MFFCFPLSVTLYRKIETNQVVSLTHPLFIGGFRGSNFQDNNPWYSALPIENPKELNVIWFNPTKELKTIDFGFTTSNREETFSNTKIELEANSTKLIRIDIPNNYKNKIRRSYQNRY